MLDSENAHSPPALYIVLMTTQYYTATSLDGYIATEDNSLDWLFPLGDVNDTSYPDFVAQVGALAMGSTTYEWMLRHAEVVQKETGSPWPYTQPAWISGPAGPNFSRCVADQKGHAVGAWTPPG